MFSDVCPARTNAAILMMLIATTSSHTCTKPTVACWFTPVAPKRKFHSQSKVFRHQLLHQHEQICRRSAEKNLSLFGSCLYPTISSFRTLFQAFVPFLIIANCPTQLKSSKIVPTFLQFLRQ